MKYIFFREKQFSSETLVATKFGRSGPKSKMSCVAPGMIIVNSKLSQTKN
jgi:hypothetical protein